MASVALSLMVLAALALVLGAGWLWRRGGQRKQIILMLVLAAVIAVNVGLWTFPDPNGLTLADEAKN